MLGELQLVEKEINGGNPPVASNDEIGPGVSWCLTSITTLSIDHAA
jgi:hypothetical protein